MEQKVNSKNSLMKQKKRFFFIFIQLTIFLLTFLLPSLTFSLPQIPIHQEITMKQIELEKAKEELSLLETELEIAVEAYNAAQMELLQTQASLATTKLNYESVKEEYQRQTEILNQRVKIIYKEGDIQYLEVLLNTKGFIDFIRRLHFLLEIGEADAKFLKRINEEKDRLDKIKMELEQLEEKQALVKDRIEAKKSEIEMKIAEKEAYMKTLSQDIQLLLQQEALMKEKEREKIKDQVDQLIKDLNISIPEGSVVFTALRYLGVPYLWAGENPETGFDCSGLVKYVFALHGVDLPHYSGAQFQLGINVDNIEDLQPGDLVFFGNPVHHVGIYMGSGYFIHAPQSGDFVRVTRLSERVDYAGARRIFAPPLFEFPTSEVPTSGSYLREVPTSSVIPFP